MNLLIVAEGLHRTVGGPAVGTRALLNALGRIEGVHPTLVHIPVKGREDILPDPNLARIIGVPGFTLRGFNALVPGLRGELEKAYALAKPDLVYRRSIWSPATHTTVGFALSKGLPIVVTPHGSLTPWSMGHKAWKKRLAWTLYQKQDMERVNVIHATADSEADNIRNLGLRNPIAVVPNGVELPPWEDTPPAEKSVRTLLFLSRIHPKKGLLNLVEAWAALRPKGWRVLIAGPDEGGYKAVVQEAIKKSGCGDDFEFAGEVYGDEKWALYAQADLFVLPTFNENFGIAIAEALASGLPVITTQETPWAEIRDRSCGWWIPVGAAPLAETLREALSLSDAQRRTMGREGRRLAVERYSWESVAARMKALFDWMIRGGTPPTFVRMG